LNGIAGSLVSPEHLLRVPTVVAPCAVGGASGFRQCCRVVGLGQCQRLSCFGASSAWRSSGFAGFSFGGSSGLRESPAR